MFRTCNDYFVSPCLYIQMPKDISSTSYHAMNTAAAHPAVPGYQPQQPAAPQQQCAPVIPPYSPSQAHVVHSQAPPSSAEGASRESQQHGGKEGHVAALHYSHDSWQSKKSSRAGGIPAHKQGQQGVLGMEGGGLSGSRDRSRQGTGRSQVLHPPPQSPSASNRGANTAGGLGREAGAEHSPPGSPSRPPEGIRKRVSRKLSVLLCINPCCEELMHVLCERSCK